MGNSHNNVAKFAKQVTLEGLGKKIGNHVCRGAMKQVYIAGGDSVFDKEVSNVDMS
jgi:hypothetical protein